MVVVAAGAAALAAWWWTPNGRALRAGATVPGVRGGRGRTQVGRGGRRARRLFVGAVAVVGLVLGVGLGVGWAGGGALVTVALVGALLTGTGARLTNRRRERLRRVAARRGVAAAAESVAALMRAGRMPTQALTQAASDCPVLREAAAELASGGEVADALRRSALAPGQEGLRQLADAWQVAVRTGAGLTEAWQAVAENLEAEEEVARSVLTEMAAARAAGRVMGVLPVAGVGLAYLWGGDPAAFWLGSVGGAATAVTGVALGCLGVVWTDVVVERAGGR
nr:type II secretion system F family protein [Propioniciclava soli]